MRALHTLTCTVCLAIASLSAMHAFAQPPAADAKPLVDHELDELRGGYYTVDGYTFDFGASIRTRVDGVPVLESALTFGPDGARVTSGTPGGPIAGLNGFNGISLQNATGETTIVHRLVDGQIQGIIFNDASGRTIQQDIGISLELPGFAAVQSNIDAARTAGRLNADMALGLVSSARN